MAGSWIRTSVVVVVVVMALWRLRGSTAGLGRRVRRSGSCAVHALAGQDREWDSSVQFRWIGCLSW